MKKLIRFYNKLEENVLIFSLVVTVVLIFAQVVMRKVFNASLTWSEELARYLFIWQIWLGTSIGYRDGKHISISLIRDKLKGKGVAAYDLLSALILLAFCIFLIYMGWAMVQRLFATNYLSAALRMPVAFVYLSLPFSALAVALRILAKMVKDVKLLFGMGNQPLNLNKGEGGV